MLTVCCLTPPTKAIDSRSNLERESRPQKSQSQPEQISSTCAKCWIVNPVAGYHQAPRLGMAVVAAACDAALKKGASKCAHSNSDPTPQTTVKPPFFKCGFPSSMQCIVPCQFPALICVPCHLADKICTRHPWLLGRSLQCPCLPRSSQCAPGRSRTCSGAARRRPGAEPAPPPASNNTHNKQHMLIMIMILIMIITTTY